ncbi:hypothetical protein [uncultured Maricaulis sp.]|uniref:SctD/MshK family protein n=1 Tax=uncultured Maricaulis sp. TaxID=174710 RepID=UPI0030D97898|tara:strand:- start:1794 stop:2300 length:507 start_codon:yes stop_codon:yes gene_type:complete
MMPLSLARLGAAGLVAVAAGLAGLVIAPRAAPPLEMPQSTSAGGPGPVLQSDISALSARLRASGLFPAAVPLNAGEPSEAEAAAVLAALGDGAGEAVIVTAPPIKALVREDGVWRLHAGGAITERARLIEGDELYDGWRITEIGASHIVVSRGDETHSIFVFDPSGEG